MKFKPLNDLDKLAKTTPEQFGKIVRALEEVTIMKGKKIK